MSEGEGYRHYYGVCEEPGHPPLVISVEVHPDAGPDAVVTDPEDWDGFGIQCPVCGDTVSGRYEGADNDTRDRERGRLAWARHLLARVESYANQCGMLRTEPSTAGLRKALPPSQEEVEAIKRIPEDQRTEEHVQRLREAERR